MTGIMLIKINTRTKEVSVGVDHAITLSDVEVLEKAFDDIMGDVIRATEVAVEEAKIDLTIEQELCRRARERLVKESILRGEATLLPECA